MSRPVSTERPKSSGRTYTDEEWERVKDQFHHYYMDKNMSLKDAARCMSEIHGFDATLRQWERRIAPEKWGFSKYASRDDRLKAIDASGKSLLDVSQRGRRKSTASDGRPSLLEDRNLRRFARREVSRESRHRARSVSVLSDHSDQDMSDNSGAPSPAASDMMMDSQNDTSLGMFANSWMSPQPGPASRLPVIRIFGESQNPVVPEINISGPEDTYMAPNHVSLAMQMSPNPQYPLDHHANASAAFQNQMSDQFSGLPLQSGEFGTASMAEEVDTATLAWNDPFAIQNQRQAHKSGQEFPGFAFENDNSMSYTEMLQIGSTDTENVIASSERLETFENEVPFPQESSGAADDTLEIDPDFDDPTYVDVFSLIKERDNEIAQMVSMLKHSYQNSTSAEHATKHVISSIELLEKGIHAQSIESERDVRRTLKNISSTQRRAAQNIRILSTQRRRKIEQLQSQVNALNMNQHHSFTYG